MPDQSLIEVFDDVVYENNAQEVFKKLYDLDNLKDRLVARWIWELIQNARGNAGSQNQLQIEVLLENERLIFRHNGAPFKKREIAHLIFHGSSKHDPKDIGKFGSGFITTHLISRCVTVRGSLDDGRHFDFVLNREGTDAAQLLEAMEKSKSEFLESVGRVTQSIPVPFTTEYTYPMSDAIREVVSTRYPGASPVCRLHLRFQSHAPKIENLYAGRLGGSDPNPLSGYSALGCPALDAPSGREGFATILDCHFHRRC